MRSRMVIVALLALMGGWQLLAGVTTTPVVKGDISVPEEVQPEELMASWICCAGQNFCETIEGAGRCPQGFTQIACPCPSVQEP